MVTKFTGFIRKSRTVPDVVVPAPPASRQYNASGVLQSSFAAGHSFVSHSKSEQIVYTNHVKGEPLRDNRCLHTKTQFDYSGDGTKFDRVNILNPSFPGWYFEYYGGHSTAVDAHSSAVASAIAAFGVPTGMSVLNGSAQSYVNDAFNRAQPDLTTVSLPNFLLELGDIKSLFELWKSNVSLAKNLAGARLNYSFGWKPTIGDVAAMLDAVRSFKDKLQHFRESLNSITNKDYLMSKVAANKTGSSYNSTTHGRTDWTGSLSGTVKVHLKFKYLEIPEMSNTELELRGLLDTLGFELNPRIIWDALPFTFVIDWFFGVGSWLQNFKIDTLELPISCLDASVSYKEVLKVESTTTFNPTGWPTDATSTEVMGGCVTTSTLFDRRPFLPDFATLSGLGWRKPSFNQLVNLTSLVVVLGGK